MSGCGKWFCYNYRKPEIHLHPKAQSKLCEFLYFVSQSGRQLFIETHSDHIFNGLRVGVANGSMNQEDISVNFFCNEWTIWDTVQSNYI